MSRRNFTRKSGFRDSKLIVIASEGQKTENIYFSYFKTFYNNRRVHVEVLDRLDSSSDPARILRMLDNFHHKFSLKSNHDQLWLVIDVDRWGNAKLAQISAQCIQKGYNLAVSNPAFDLWILFHVRSLDNYSQQEKIRLRENSKDGTSRTRIERELVSILGSYNKSNPDMEFFCAHIDAAVQNARQADTHPAERWPNDLGSRVYLLIEAIRGE